MIRILRFELYKIFKRPRTYISFGIITAISAVIQMALLADGRSFVNFALQGVSEQFTLQGNILNGYLITLIILQTLLIHIPLLVALVAGDMVAGEASLGTLRLLLTRPISRAKLILAKFLASMIYSWLLLLWLAIAALLVSVLLFGTGDLIHLKSESFILLLRNDILWRYMAAFGFAALAMTAVASLALLLSVFAENSIGPIISTMGIIIVFTIITNLGIPVFDLFKPYLLTTHMIAWKGFFDDPVPYTAIGRSALVLVMYTVLLTWLTIYFFNRKDIRS
ncbi:ABC transporter permease [Chitinophagaceae bacterium MMS25-I14]